MNYNWPKSSNNLQNHNTHLWSINLHDTSLLKEQPPPTFMNDLSSIRTQFLPFELPIQLITSLHTSLTASSTLIVYSNCAWLCQIRQLTKPLMLIRYETDWIAHYCRCAVTYKLIWQGSTLKKIGDNEKCRHFLVEIVLVSNRKEIVFN